MTTSLPSFRRSTPDRPLSQLWQVPTFFLGILALSLVAAQSYFHQDPFAARFQQEITALRHGLATKGEKIEPLVALAENLVVQADRIPPRGGEAHFLIGSAYWRQAQELPRDRVLPVQARAEEYLEKALKLGVGDSDLPALRFRLGMLLHQQGKNSPRVLELLGQGIDKGAEVPSRGYEMLVEAHLRQERPNLQAALDANERQLATMGDSDEELARARLLRGELLYRAGKRVDALRILERIGATAPKTIRGQARLLQTRCCEAEGLWRRAIPIWKELLDDPAVVPGGKAQVLYALGLCHVNLDQPEPDQAGEFWQEAVALGGEEAQAASIRIGELRLTADPRATLKAWSHALGKVQKASDYRNAYVTIEQLREYFESACRHLLEAQDYQTTEQVAELYARVALPGRAELQLAQASESLARQLLEKKSPESTPMFVRAAKAYETVAQLRNDADKSEYLWRSAACYLPASQYGPATAVLEKFVKVEKVEGRLAEGHLALAEAYLALKQRDKALKAYYRCIEFPDTPFAYRARYQLALEERENKNFEQAISILLQNLRTSGNGAIDREAQERSQYLLGDIYFQVQKFDQAAITLKEAVRQYPHNPNLLKAREQLGDCYRRMADALGARAREPGIKDESREYHQRRKTERLDEAAKAYQELADDLETQARKTPLGPDDLRLLRKVLFGVADIYYEMNDLTEALRRFQLLQDRYRKQVESLIACQRIWLCRARVVEPPDKVRLFEDAVRNSLQMAQTDLLALDDSSKAFQGGPGVWRKQDWENWIGWVNRQLTPTPTAVAPTTPLQK